jgi:membrane protease YdiL (CAAX protease family)
MRRLFLSPTETRLRAGWRLLIQSVVYLLLAFCIGAELLIPYSFLGGKDLNGVPYMLASEVIELFAITASVFLARRLLDRRSIASLGLQLEWRLLLDLLVGLAISFVMMGLIYLGMYRMGWIHFEGFAWQSQPPLTVLANFLLILFIFIVVGWNEELLSRGYHLQTLASGLNLTWGVILSSAVFGLLHIFNPNATWISVVGIFLAGLFLAYAYLRTQRLWLSIGLHIGWNFYEGVVFGFPVSGLAVYPLTRITVSGPSLWTGGAFGPEAGLVVLPALAVGVGLVYAYTRKRLASSG